MMPLLGFFGSDRACDVVQTVRETAAVDNSADVGQRLLDTCKRLVVGMFMAANDASRLSCDPDSAFDYY